MKTIVYSKAALRHRIVSAAELIRNHPDNIASATQSLLMRAENCIATGGEHFEQLLQSTSSILVQASSRLIANSAVTNGK
jgi:hypothetical protein